MVLVLKFLVRASVADLGAASADEDIGSSFDREEVLSSGGEEDESEACRLMASWEMERAGSRVEEEGCDSGCDCCEGCRRGCCGAAVWWPVRDTDTAAALEASVVLVGAGSEDFAAAACALLAAGALATPAGGLAPTPRST